MSETKPTTDDLSRIAERIARLSQELHAAKEEQRLAVLAYWGFKIGDPVRETKKRQPRTGVIVSVEQVWGLSSKPWANVRLNKKDGTAGERVVNFYDDYEHAEISATEAA